MHCIDRKKDQADDLEDQADDFLDLKTENHIANKEVVINNLLFFRG